MATLAEIRAQHPEYEDMSDEQLAQGLHRRFYSDMPYEQFAQRVGLSATQPAQRDPFEGQPYNEAEARVATGVRGFSWNTNDEIQGAGAALAAPFRGRDPLREFDRVSRRTRALTERYRAERPVGAVADEVAGALSAFNLPGAARALAGRVVAEAPRVAEGGMRALAGQMGRGGFQGAASGYAYGFNDQGDLSERLDRGNQGAAFGAGVGVATPPLIAAGGAAVRPVGRVTGEWLSRIAPAPNTLGAGPVVSVRPPTPRGPRVSPAAMGTIDRLANRTQMTPDAVEQAFAAARANPQGQRLVDTFGETGGRTIRPIVQSPGQTTELAARAARTRFREAPGRIISSLRERLGVGESRTQALGRLEREYADASANLYNPLWRERTTPQQRQMFDEMVGPHLEDPVMIDAISRAERIFARDRRLGRVTGDAQDNLARYMHYIRLGLNDAATAARRDPTGAQSTELAGIKALRSVYTDAIERIVPGYRAARERWAGLADAEEAIDLGASWVGMTAEEVAQSRAGMTPFELMHARIGLADEIRGMTRGRVVGQANVANRLDDPDMQGAIAAAFDDPAQAAAFLDTVNTQNELMRMASQWGGGSQSFSNLAFGADEALNAAGDIAGNVLSGNARTAAGQGGRSVWRAFTSGLQERANNARGEALLTRVDTPDSEAFARAVVAELRRRMQVRQTNAAASRTGATIAAPRRERR